MSELRSPCETSPRTSSSRDVGWAGFCLVAGRGPRGSPRAPRSRSRLATIAAAGRAPNRCNSSSAWLAASPLIWRQPASVIACEDLAHLPAR